MIPISRPSPFCGRRVVEAPHRISGNDVEGDESVRSRRVPGADENEVEGRGVESLEVPGGGCLHHGGDRFHPLGCPGLGVHRMHASLLRAEECDAVGRRAYGETEDGRPGLRRSSDGIRSPTRRPRPAGRPAGDRVQDVVVGDGVYEGVASEEAESRRRHRRRSRGVGPLDRPRGIERPRLDELPGSIEAEGVLDEQSVEVRGVVDQAYGVVEELLAPLNARKAHDRESVDGIRGERALVSAPGERSHRSRSTGSPTRDGPANPSRWR